MGYLATEWRDAPNLFAIVVWPWIWTANEKRCNSNFQESSQKQVVTWSCLITSLKHVICFVKDGIYHIIYTNVSLWLYKIIVVTPSAAYVVYGCLQNLRRVKVKNFWGILCSASWGHPQLKEGVLTKLIKLGLRCLLASYVDFFKIDDIKQLCIWFKNNSQPQRKSINGVNSSCFENNTWETSVTNVMHGAPH